MDAIFSGMGAYSSGSAAMPPPCFAKVHNIELNAYKVTDCINTKKGQAVLDLLSGRQDSNLRPPGPKPGALPGCATPRMLYGK